jgi:hypothetical protein
MTRRADRNTRFSRLLRESKHDTRRRLAREARARVDVPVLTVEGVAKMLHCTVQAVRRIPDDVLPRHRLAGRRNQYLPDEVICAVRSNRIPRVNADELIQQIDSEEIESRSDSGRRRRRRRS